VWSIEQQCCAGKCRMRGRAWLAAAAPAVAWLAVVQGPSAITPYSCHQLLVSLFWRQPDFRLGRCLSGDFTPNAPQYRAGHSFTARASVPQFLGAVTSTDRPPLSQLVQKEPSLPSEQRIFAIAADQPAGFTSA